MGNLAVRMAPRSFLAPARVVAVPSLWARGHCQVPCGIFHDDGRITSMVEDATTIRKSVVEAEKLFKAGGLQDMHQMVRWINTKEAHASNIMTAIADYFLAQ